MTTSIGRVVLDIAANAAGFERDIKKVETSARREFRKVSRELRFAQRDLDQARAKVRNLALAISAISAAGVVGAARAFKSFANEADRIQKLATATGLTAESVQTLGFAAEQSGSDFEVLVKGVQQLQRNIQGAQDGLSTYTRAFGRIGVEVQELIGLSPEQQFKRIAQALSEVEDPTTRTATALEVFGRAGRELLPLFDQGVAGIERLEEQLLSTGSVLSGDATRASERFNDALNVLRLQARSVGVSIFSDLVEPLADYVEFLANTEQGQELLRSALEDIANAAKVVGAAVGVGLVAALIKLTAQLIIAEVRVGRLTAAKLALGGASRGAAAGVAIFGRAVSIATGPIGIGLTILGSLALAFVSVRDRVNEAIPELDEFQSKIDQILSGTASFQKGQLENSLLEIGGRVAEINNEIGSLEEQLIGFAQRDGLGPITDDEIRAKIAQLRSEKGRLGEAATELARRLENLETSTGTLNNTNDEAARAAEKLANQIADLEASFGGPAQVAIRRFNRQAADAKRLLDESKISVNLYDRAIAAYGEEVRRALDPSEELAEQLAEQAELAAEAEDAFMGVRDELIQQIVQTQGAGEALRQYQRQLFVAEQLSRLGENATAEYRAEVERLAGALFDLEFPADEARSWIEALSDAVSEGLVRGLQDGLVQGIGQIDAQDVLDGNFAEIGNQLGQTLAVSAGRGIGTALGGPIGGEIGALIGDIIGSALFGGSVPKFQVRGTNATRAIDEGTDETIDSPLATIEFAFRDIEAETRAQVRQAFIEFDTTIASFIRNTDQLTAIEAALDAFGVSSRSDGEDLQGLLQLRFDAILSTFDQVTQDVVRAAGQTLETQVQALADIQSIAIQEALGRGLGLDDALPIIAELQIPGEALANTFDRLRTVTQLLDAAAGLTGATFGEAREDVLRFGADLAAAFGDDLARAGQLLGRIFDTFFEESERLEVQIAQSTARAVDLLASIGIDATDEILSRGGFRALFDELSGILSPEDLAVLIEAGAEIANLIDAEEQLAEASGDAADSLEAAAERAAELSELLRDVGLEALSVVAPARAEYAELAASINSNIERARELGATEEQLAFIRRASEIQIRGFIASLSQSIADLTQQLFGAGPQIDAIGSAVNVAASAATNFRDQWLSAIDSISDALNDQLLGPNSTLTAQERQQESVNQFQQALAAAQAGDLGAAQSLPQLFQQALAEGASFFGTTSTDFAQLEAQLRSALENADLPVPPQSPETQTAQNTAVTAQAVQQVEQTALDQLLAATQLIDQIGLLADLTGDTPAEIGAEFGIPIADLIEILTGEVPDLTGDALAEYFNELTAEAGEQLNELAQLEAIETQSRDILAEIRDLLARTSDPAFTQPIPEFETGGPVNQTGLALVHAGEYVVPAGGALVGEGGSFSNSVLEDIRAEIRAGNNQRESVLRDQRRGLGAVVSAQNEIRNELKKKQTGGKPALTRA